MRFLRIKYVIKQGVGYLLQVDSDPIYLFVYLSLVQEHLNIPFSVTIMEQQQDNYKSVIIDCRHRVVINPQLLAPWDTIQDFN